MVYHVYGIEYQIIQSVTDSLWFIAKMSKNQEEQLDLFLEEHSFRLDVLQLADWFIEKRIRAFSISIFDKHSFKIRRDLIQIWESFLFMARMKKAGLLILDREYMEDIEYEFGDIVKTLT